MATNVKDPNSILLGNGILKQGGRDVGQLSGSVQVDYDKTYYKVEAGQPKTTIKQFLVGEEAKLTAGMIEINPTIIGNLVTEFTQETQSSSTTEVVDEVLASGVSAGAWTATEHSGWASAVPVVRLASLVNAEVDSGALVVHVEDASVFSAGDSVTIASASASDEMTIAAEGVDETANTLTLTEGLVHGFAVGAKVVNTTVSLTEGTDYRLDRIDGGVTRISTSTKIADGDLVAVSYTYTSVSAQILHFGGLETSAEPEAIDFYHTRDDGAQWHVHFYKAKITGSFSLAFNEDKETILDVTVEAQTDSTRVAGKQLGYIALEVSA